MNLYKKAALGLTAAAILALPLSACSSSSKSGSGSSSSPAADPSAPLATVNDLSKGKTTGVTLDADFLKALTSLKLTPGVVGTAKLDATTGVVTFPITSGNVKYYNPTGPVQPFVTGDIKHAGSGLSLTAGATKVTLTNFDINPGTSKLYGDVAVNGKVAVKNAYLFFLDGKTLKPLATVGTDAVLEGTKVEISPDAAALLNTTFKTTAVKANLLVGIAKITVATA